MLPLSTFLYHLVMLVFSLSSGLECSESLTHFLDTLTKAFEDEIAELQSTGYSADAILALNWLKNIRENSFFERGFFFLSMPSGHCGLYGGLLQDALKPKNIKNTLTSLIQGLGEVRYHLEMESTVLEELFGTEILLPNDSRVARGSLVMKEGHVYVALLKKFAPLP